MYIDCNLQLDFYRAVSSNPEPSLLPLGSTYLCFLLLLNSNLHTIILPVFLLAFST